MATSTRNVIVGSANLFISNKNGANRPTTKATDISSILTAGSSARVAINAGSDYREVGFTTTGIEISYEPVYGEVMVDQLLDAARLFKQTLKVILKTELVEATLENLTLSWGQSDFYTDASGNPVYTLSNTGTSSTYKSTLNLAAGAVGDTPVERVLLAVGSAPRQIGSSYDPAAAAVVSPLHTSDLKQKERVYVARRVVNIDTTMHGLKRDAATVFPVNFRCLPDDSQVEYAGTEYGVVIDRVWGTI
jgi:microcompartment protein CcmK/EutM